MISELFSSLAAPVFAALLLLLFLKSRSREITGREASSNAAGNEETAGGASSTHSSTGVPERAPSSGPAKYAAANDRTAGGDFGAYTSTGVPEMATSSGPTNDAAANDGTAGGASGAYTSTGVPEMATSSTPAKDAAADDETAGGDSSAHSSIGVPEMATSTGYDYEVFLSFRGTDTREAFTDHLYTSLVAAGIRTFKDDEDLRKGEEFAPKLLQAIKQSKILVPIFSKDYATSVWCLKEVVQMVECRKTGGQKIMPIFYDVAPSEVRHQIGSYREALRSHENKKRHDEKTIEAWKAALSAVGEINGYNLQSMPNRREGEFVKTFTHKVFNELKMASLAVSDYLVGVDDHVDAIMEKIGDGTSETRIIGIHGMGGIGKTTIAKIIFNKFADDFENRCFLRDIRETSKTRGIQYLQMQLISSILKMECMDIKDIHEGNQTIKNRLSNKRVLLLLDDVEEADHIDALVCKRDWLGEGSKIIITSRRIDVLDVQEVDWRYELTGMDRNQSLRLFSKHAFRRDSPLDEYINQSNRAIKISGGLPLAIEIIGSHLSRTKKEKWDPILDRLADVPDAEVQRRLKISYDALEFREKQIFLDIACLFIGYDKDILVLFWESNFFPEEAMEVLQNMSLIKITEDNKVQMHDLLRDLGREVVRHKSDMEIEKQSRVWDPKAGSDLLWKHEGRKEVQAPRLNFDHEDQHSFTCKDFENLSHLRFLEVVGLRKRFHAEERLLWHESLSNALPINENSYLLPRLRWLSWNDFPPTFNIANFFMKDVVILNLSKSQITDDWKGWSHMKVMKNLKVLNLSKCRNLQRLPDELGKYLASLEYLSLEDCVWLERLPNSIENLESLVELDISRTRIEELPDSIGKLKNLRRLKMRECEISKIPNALWTIEKLEEIEVSKTYVEDHFHVNIGNCISKNQSLRILKLDDADIRAPPRLPESLVTLHLDSLNMDTFPDLSNLANLKELELIFESRDSDGPVEEYPMPRWMGNLSKLESLTLKCPFVTTSPADLTLPPHLKSIFLRCTNLRHLPRLPSSLSSLDLYECKSLCSMESLDLSSPHVIALPADLTLPPPRLKELRLYDCPNLRHLPRLPSSLSSLYLSVCSSLCSVEDLSNLKNLSSLLIRDSAIGEIQGLGCLENLRDLKLLRLEQVVILPDLSNLNKLTSLRVENCNNLVEIQGALPRLLDKLHISSCDSLQNLPDMSSLVGKQQVEILDCGKLNVEAVLQGGRINQPDMQPSTFEELQVLPNLSGKRRLEIRDYHDLVEIRGELPRSLEVLVIDSCESLIKLPDLSSLKELQEVSIKGCKELKGEAIIGSSGRSQENLWENLQYLRICDLERLEILPDLSNLNKLRHLEIQSCANLAVIDGEFPKCLEELEISSCKILQELPNLSSLNKLREVKIVGCFELNVEAISSLCSEKSIPFVGDEWDREDVDSESEYEYDGGEEE